MSHLRSLVFISSVLMAGACQDRTPDPSGSELSAPGAEVQPLVSEVRACDSGASVATQGEGRSQIQLTYKDRVMTLDRVPTGQGQAYRGEGAEWTLITKGGEEVGRLSLAENGGKPTVVEQCRRPAPELVAAPEVTALKPCISPDLAYGIESGDAAMGHRLTTVRVENRGHTACQLSGYPQVKLIAADGQPLTKVKAEARTDSYFGTIRAGVPILLQAGEKAFFDLGWGVMPHEAEGETTCPQAASVRLAPPGDGGAKALALAITPCGGKVEVSPYRAVADRQAVTVAKP